MNSFWTFVSSVSLYKGGKSVGLVGIFGILLALVLWYFKGFIYKGLNFLGVIRFLNDLHLIDHEQFGLGITLFNILVFFLVLYVIIAVLFLVLGGVLAILFSMVDTRIGALIGKGIVYVIAVFPLLFLVIYPSLLLKEIALFLSDPKTYIRDFKDKPEYKKMIKFYEPVRFIAFEGVDEKIKPKMHIPLREMPRTEEGKLDWKTYIFYNYGEPIPQTNQITLEETKLRVNRLPMVEDKDFIVGVSRSFNGRDLFNYHIILPKPQNLGYYKTDYFMCEHIHEVASSKIVDNHNSRELVFDNSVPMIEWDKVLYNRPEEVPIDSFIYFFDPCRLNQSEFFDQEFSNEYMRYSFREYVENCQEMYFRWINEMREELREAAKSPDELRALAKKIKELEVYNEDIVAMMYEEKEGRSI